MKFRTEIQVPTSESVIGYQSKILSMGSCFADRMGDRLTEMKFQTLVNPLGIFYNPISISKVLNWGLKGESDLNPQFANHLGEWHSFDLHGKFRHVDQNIFLSKVEEATNTLTDYLPNTDCLILTFGTAFVFRKKSDREIVANCHKYSGNLFSRELLTVEEITRGLESTFRGLKQQNPSLRIILTVSPIRHVRDGLSQNNLSKSTLRLACDELAKKFEEVSYFPAYEIMMDDLRDYRFYKEDLIHPTIFAEDYIWEKFVQTYLSKDSQNLMNEWQKIYRDLTHRPLNENSPAYRKFLIKLKEKLEAISEKINCQSEISMVEQKIHHMGH